MTKRINRQEKKCVIWTRVSRNNPNRGYCYGMQVAECTDFAYTNGYHINTYFADMDAREKTLTDICNYLKSHKSIGSIIINGYDRLSRKKETVCEVINRLREIGVTVVAVNNYKKNNVNYDRF